MSNDHPTFAMFENRVGEMLHLKGEPDNLPVKLAEATLLSHSQREGGSFSLVLETDVEIEQGSYQLQDEGGLDIIVFLVPIGPRGDAFGYETIFN